MGQKTISNSFNVNVVNDGADGYSSAVVQLFRRSSTALGNGDRPTGTLTYTFATGVLSGTASYFNGWSQSMPQASEGTKLYVTMATARSQGATDTIAASEWSTPVEYVADGMKYASVIIYKRSASQPTDKPANGAVYTFATGGLTGTLNGWSTAIPATNANHDPCWVRHATAVSSGTTDTIAASEWSDPAVKLVEDGAGGVVATVIPGELSVQCDKDGRVATAISGQPLSFVLTVGGVECTNVKATRPTSGVTPPLPALPNGVSVPPLDDTIVSISVAKQYAPAAGQTAPVTDTMLAAGATFLVKGTDAAGNEVTSRCTLGLKGQRQGETGDDGPATPTYELIFDSYQASYNAQSTAFSLSAHVRVLKTEGTSSSYILEDAYTPEYKLSNGDTWYAMTKASSDFTCSVNAPYMSTAPVTVNFRLKNGSTVLCTAAMPITIKGDKGETGRMFYMMGDWDENVTYTRTDEVVPMVFHKSSVPNNYNGLYGDYFYLNSSSASGSADEPADEPGNKWKKCDDFGVVITQGIFADFAKLGEGIFSGDWLYSTYGSIGSTTIDSSHPNYSGKKGYLYFDASAPQGSRDLGISGSVSGSEPTEIGSYFQLSSGCKVIRVTGRVANINQKMIVVVRKYSKGATNLGIEEFTSASTSYETKDIVIKDIDNDFDYYIAAYMNGGYGSGIIAAVELVSFAPNYAVDLLTGTTYQRKGIIGGFSIGDTKLENTNYDAGIEIKNSGGNQYSQRVAIGADASDTMTGRKAAMVAEAKEANTGNDRPYNTALYLDAHGATYNYAFHGQGNGVLNGLMFGFRTKVYTMSSSTNDETVQMKLTDGATIVIEGYKQSGFFYLRLPTLADVREALGILENVADTPFAIEIGVINHSKTENAVLLGYSSSRTALPKLTSYDYNDAPESPDFQLQLGSGDYTKLLLTYSPSLGYRCNVLIRWQTGWGTERFVVVS